MVGLVRSDSDRAVSPEDTRRRSVNVEIPAVERAHSGSGRDRVGQVCVPASAYLTMRCAGLAALPVPSGSPLQSAIIAVPFSHFRHAAWVTRLQPKEQKK